MSRYQVNSMQDIRVTAEKLHMNLDQMRFFVGENRYDARCFGIYQDPSSLEFVVYKNKASGDHVERYRGYDEAEASQIFWDKIESETELRQARYDGAVSAAGTSYRESFLQRSLQGNLTGLPPNGPGQTIRQPHRRSPQKSKTGRIIFWVIICSIALNFVVPLLNFLAYQDRLGKNRTLNGGHRTGYYEVGDDLYYYQGGNNWYYYDALADTWDRFYDYEDSWYDDYYYGSSYDFDDPYDSFYYSDYYIDYTGNDYGSSYDYDDYDYSYDYDYDYDDYDWDWGDSDWDSWDSYDTDWDSDW